VSIPGYAGKILHVDLTSGRTREEPLEPELVERFLGGYGINNWLAYRCIPPDVDPLSPENAVILGAGTFTGTLVPGAAKLLVTTKFPINGAFGTASGGGAFAMRLKSCGYDHVVITGRAREPVYLLISGRGCVELRDAGELWGKDNYDTADRLRERHEPCSIIPIGPAGERQVALSITSIDKAATIGRGGLPAVMGAKRLKAVVACQGEVGIEVADRRSFLRQVNALHERILRWPPRAELLEKGLAEAGYTVSSSYAVASELPRGMEEAYVALRRRLACPSCPLGEKSRVCLPDGEFVGTLSYMPHFWMENFGGEGRSAHDRALKYADTLNRLGLCHMNFSHLFLFACELYRQGAIGREHTRGVELRPDLDTALLVARQTAYREGLGEVLAQGLVPAARYFGGGALERLTHVKGQAVLFDPRLRGLGTMEFSQMINHRGAHVAAGGSPAYFPDRPPSDFLRHGERMGATEKTLARAVGEGDFNPGRYTKISDDWFTVFHCLGICNRAFVNRFYHVRTVSDLYRALTGRPLGPRALMEAAERAFNLGKLLNTRAGFGREDDAPPRAWFEPLRREGKAYSLRDYYSTRTLTPADLDRFLDDYYAERGYDPRSGEPSPAIVAELGLVRAASGTNRERSGR
jgi:aldehyde:ferredoxin oxidoreductase